MEEVKVGGIIYVRKKTGGRRKKRITLDELFDKVSLRVFNENLEDARNERIGRLDTIMALAMMGGGKDEAEDLYGRKNNCCSCDDIIRSVHDLRASVKCKRNFIIESGTLDEIALLQNIIEN